MPDEEGQSRIPPMPLPTQVTIVPGTGPDGDAWTVMICTTPAGENIYWFNRADARAIASMLRKQAERGPELVKPPSGLLIPG